MDTSLFFDHTGICTASFDPMWTTITIGGHTDRWRWMRRSRERFSHQSWGQSRSYRKWAVYITITNEWRRESVSPKCPHVNCYRISGPMGTRKCATTWGSCI